MEQLSHDRTKNIKKKFPITIVCDELRTPENIGMCFRIAESFGVQKIYLHENSPNTTNRIVQRTARSTIHKVIHETYTDIKKLIKTLHEKGNSVLGIEITNESNPLQKYNFTQHEKIVLLLGSERNGIKDIELVDESIVIPMYGSNSSMNVIHSLAITLYEITNQLTRIND